MLYSACCAIALQMLQDAQQGDRYALDAFLAAETILNGLHAGLKACNISATPDDRRA